MLGDFIGKTLVVLLGYAYPAFECYKTVERSQVEIEQLQFWCKYWIIIALLTVFERFCDILVSWLPLYGEVKLGFVIYLWYPKTMGTSYVYETFLRPNVAQYETEIERMVMEFKTKAWDLIVFHFRNCVKYGHSAIFEFLQYLASQSTKHSDRQTPKQEKAPPPSPSPPSKSATLDRLVLSPPKALHVQDHLPRDAFAKLTDHDRDHSSPSSSSFSAATAAAQDSSIAEALQAAGTRLRRSRPS